MCVFICVCCGFVQEVLIRVVIDGGMWLDVSWDSDLTYESSQSAMQVWSGLSGTRCKRQSSLIIVFLSRRARHPVGGLDTQLHRKQRFTPAVPWTHYRLSASSQLRVICDDQDINLKQTMEWNRNLCLNGKPRIRAPSPLTAPSGPPLSPWKMLNHEAC